MTSVSLIEIINLNVLSLARALFFIMCIFKMKEKGKLCCFDPENTDAYNSICVKSLNLAFINKIHFLIYLKKCSYT